MPQICCSNGSASLSQLWTVTSWDKSRLLKFQFKSIDKFPVCLPPKCVWTKNSASVSSCWCSWQQTDLLGCTRLYSAWRKWTSETHADCFGPYCYWFQQHHHQCWHLTSPQYKLAIQQQGAWVAFLGATSLLLISSSISPFRTRKIFTELPRYTVIVYSWDAWWTF